MNGHSGVRQKISKNKQRATIVVRTQYDEGNVFMPLPRSSCTYGRYTQWIRLCISCGDHVDPYLFTGFPQRFLPSFQQDIVMWHTICNVLD
ncbi:hypothetical protein TNCT_369131 [Trichonephila clavata]|uniref:Uncharacterized protein n=1 Tax=Trichonephila clavata TaxID=2740835 RepID=A0A8X6LTW1_TRICU|nr:hypothetical protein TNCT_369131 [Trichonephila clavata]